MSRNNLRYQDLGGGPATDILPSSEPYFEFYSNGQATNVNDLPTVVGITVDQDYLVVYIPGTGHRKILIANIGEFFPGGGSTGQILIKNSNSNFDVSWTNVPVGGLVDVGNQITLNGDLSGFGTFGVGGDATITATLTLPNVTLMDGGGAFSDFAAEATGPYGVLGLQPAGGTAGQALVKISATEQDVGWGEKADPIICGYDSGSPSLTVDLKRLDFEGPGVFLYSPSPGHVVAHIDNFPITDGGEYCPNYPYTYVSINSWSVVGIDRVGLFSVGKRLHFIDGIYDYYGEVTASVFSGGDTTITMAMENGAELTATVDDVCLTRGITGWQPINVQPLLGVTMNAITSGTVAGVTYWYCVGNNGQMAVSTDACASWDPVILGTTMNLNGVAFDPINERFMVSADESEVYYSADGVTWAGGYNADLYAAVSRDNGSNTGKVRYSQEHGGSFQMSYEKGQNQYDTGWSLVWSTDGGVNWTNEGNSTGATSAWGAGHNLNNNYDVYGRGSSIWSSTGGGSGTVYNIGFSNQVSGVHYFPTIQRWIAMSIGGEFKYVDSTSGATVSWTLPTTAPWVTTEITGFALSDFLAPIIIVYGKNAKIAVSFDYGDNFTEVSTGFDPATDIKDMWYDETDRIFVAIASNGEIALSVNGSTA